MNDSQQPETHSLIETLTDDEKLTFLHSRQIDPITHLKWPRPSFRANKQLHYIDCKARTVEHSLIVASIPIGQDNVRD
ncbi:hypothetical protein ACOJBO_08400 [Rhizobium beringeri]